MTTTLRFGGRSDLGMQRQNNEDSMYAGGHLIAIADGVGGAVGGEVASSLTINALSQLDADGINEPGEALQRAANDAAAAIRKTVAEDNALNGMSTTLTAILATNGGLTVGHIGDSRAYRLRDGRLERLTKDHTVVQTLVDEGQITEEEAINHPRRSWIVRALDGRGSPQLDVVAIDVEPGDRLLVCSDGLSDYVAEDDIAAGLAGDEPQDAVERLIDLALHAGGPDNITCIVADPVEEKTDQEPIIDGAVAETGDDVDSPAAAAKKGRHAARRSVGRRLAAVAAVVVILVAAAIAATAIYIHRQWYVAPAAGKVAVFQGVQGSAAGIDLSHVHATTNIPLTALPQDDRQRVLNGIDASGGQSGANTVVANLRRDACAQATASPTATPKPSPTPTSTKSPQKVGTSPQPMIPSWCGSTTP